MAIDNRYDFVMLFDVENGNPNGDPDAGNAPRMDAETGYGFVTDVCLKRKIRNYVELCMEREKGYNILIKQDRYLNEKFEEAYDKIGIKSKDKKKNPDNEKKAQKFMCENYYDVRTFGAVMTTGEYSCGIVRGPVQISFARSLSPINVQDIAIIRQARTDEKRGSLSDFEMGRKSIIPYALYRAEGYVSAALANKVTDLSERDVELLWDAIINMFEHDHSAARGKMCMRKLYVFKHSRVLGNCSSSVLFDKIQVELKEEEKPPRSYQDYQVMVDRQMPEGVELLEKL